MIDSLLDQVEPLDEEDYPDATEDQKRALESIYVRRFAIMHFIDNRETMFDRISHEIKGQYGMPEDLEGDKTPYTIKSYLKMIAKDGN